MPSPLQLLLDPASLSHSHHHGRGVHAKNYSDLPVFDLLLGTLNNARDFAAENGFYHGASSRVREMVQLRDVSRPPLPASTATAGAQAANR